MSPRGDLQLAIGYWIVSHKQTLRTWWAISLMSFIALSLLWLVIFFPLFFSQQAGLNRLMTQMAGAAAGFRLQGFQPQPLGVGPVTVVTRDQKRVDLVAEVTNGNAAWGATEVTVHFTVNGQALNTTRTFLNQSSRRWLIQSNVAVADAAKAAASLVVENTIWTRAAAASLPAASFSVDQSDLTPTTVAVAGQSISTVSFKAVMTNRSVYNFYRVVIPVVVTAGDKPVAVDTVTIDRWPTLTSKTLTATWSHPVIGATGVVLEPQVSRFDSGNVYR